MACLPAYSCWLTHRPQFTSVRNPVRPSFGMYVCVWICVCVCVCVLCLALSALAAYHRWLCQVEFSVCVCVCVCAYVCVFVYTCRGMSVCDWVDGGGSPSRSSSRAEDEALVLPPPSSTAIPKKRFREMTADDVKGDILFRGSESCQCQGMGDCLCLLSCARTAHPSCLATRHKLLGNCMVCGKIICRQEGYGPCKFCGTVLEDPAAADRKYVVLGVG